MNSLWLLFSHKQLWEDLVVSLFVRMTASYSLSKVITRTLGEAS